jgi:hypothetical protein
MFLRNIYKMKEKGYCTNEPIILKTQTNWWQEPVVCLTRTQAWNRIYHEICGFTADFATGFTAPAKLPCSQGF